MVYITGKRIFAGIGLTLIFVLIAIGKVSAAKWSLGAAVLLGFGGSALSFWAVLSQSPRKAEVESSVNAQQTSRSSLAAPKLYVILWLACVFVLLLLLRVLDYYQVPWRPIAH